MTPSFLLLSSCTLLVLSSSIPFAIAQDPVPLGLGQLVWSEEFDYTGSLKSEHWDYDIGNGNWGWGNGEVQEYTTSNVNVQNGNAVITVTEESPNTFTSARIRTNGKVEFKYGSVEARIKLPNLANGLWPAFWLLGSSFYKGTGWPFCGEIDILEAGSGGSIASGNVNQVVSSAAHWDVNGQYASYFDELNVGSSFEDEYQVYRMDWTDTMITTFVDGKLIWAFDIGSCKNTHCGEFHEPFFFIANVAVGGRFTGIMTSDQISASTPAAMEIDYIRIYDNDDIDAQVTVGGIRQAPPNATPAPAGSSTPAPTPAPATPAPVVTDNNSYNVDCGVPQTCTSSVLGTDTGNGVTCYDHIQWLMEARGRDELYACDSVARKSFPSECGGCNPGTGAPFVDYNFDCSSSLCTGTVLNTEAPTLGATCGERISHLMEVDQWSEQAACNQVAQVEFPSECGGCVPAPPTPVPTPAPTPAPTPPPTPPPVSSGTVDCGVPETCTSAVLATDTGDGVTCYDHIQWLMDVRGRDELYACDTVARKSFPSECGGCNPGTGAPFIDYSFDCGAPQLCNDNVLNTDAPTLGATCGERISHLIEVDGWSQDDACAQVAGVEFPSECGECVHDVITCGKPTGSECESVLDNISGGHSCRSRISWVVYSTGATELEACNKVATEAANAAVCGPCAP